MFGLLVHRNAHKNLHAFFQGLRRVSRPVLVECTRDLMFSNLPSSPASTRSMGGTFLALQNTSEEQCPATGVGGSTCTRATLPVVSPGVLSYPLLRQQANAVSEGFQLDL